MMADVADMTDENNMAEEWGWYVDTENMEYIVDYKLSKRTRPRKNMDLIDQEPDELDYYINIYTDTEETKYKDMDEKNPKGSNLLTYTYTTLFTTILTYIVWFYEN